MMEGLIIYLKNLLNLRIQILNIILGIQGALGSVG